MSLIKVKLTNKFAVVNDKIFSLDMKPISRLTLAWALGRPDGWEFYLESMKIILGLSEEQWKYVKKEIVPAGFFSQERKNDGKGRTVWVNNFTDAPLFTGVTLVKAAAIPEKTTDGKTTDGKTIDGKTIDGKTIDGKTIDGKTMSGERGI